MTVPPFIIPERLPGAATKYDQQNEDDFRRRLELMLRRASNVASAVPDGLLPQRKLTRHVIQIPSGFDGVSTELLFRDLAKAKEFAGLYFLQARCTRQDAWLRVYGSAADRTADLALRPNWNSVNVAPTTPMILDVLFGSGKTDIKIVDGEVDGVQAFNRDAISLGKLYARLDIPVGSGFAGAVYSETFGAAAVTEALSVSSPFTYDGTGSPSRYYRQAPYGAVWSSVSLTNNVARWAGGSLNHSADLVHRMGLTVSQNDSASWGAFLAFYVDDDPSPSVFNKLNLQIGVSRAGGWTATPVVRWVDGSGVVAVLGSGLPFSTPASSSYWVVGKIRTVGLDKIASIQTAPHEDPGNLTLRLDNVVVPPAVQVAGNDRAGFVVFRSDSPEAPYAYTGLWLHNIEFGVAVLAALNVNVDLGWTPYERAGGNLTTLVTP